MIGAAVAALIVFCAPAAARPYTVEDLVHQESFGLVAFDPTGRWLVYERRMARTRASTFAIATRHEVVENQLRVVDTRRRGGAHALITGDPAGVTMGPFSPDGRRLAVYGYRGGRWILGVATLATGRVRWFGIDAEFPYRSRSVQWRSSTELVAIGRPSGSLPLILRINSVGSRELPARWRRTDEGQVSVTAIGSGRHFELRPRKAASRLLLVDVASGRSAVLARGDIEDLEVSPGGRHVAFTEADNDVRLVADRPVQGSNGTALRHLRLGIVEIATRMLIRPCPDRDLAGQLLSWSPSGRQILVFARADTAPWSEGQVLEVATDGRVAALPLGDHRPVLALRPEVVRAAWLGETPVVLTRRGARQDWVAVRAGGVRVLTADLTAIPDRLTAVGGGAIGLAGGRAWWLTSEGAAQIAAPEGLRAATVRPLWEVRLATNPPAAVGRVPAQRRAGEQAWAMTIRPVGANPAIRLPSSGSRLVAAADDGPGLAALEEDAHGVVRLHLWSGVEWRRLDAVNTRQHDADALRALAVRDPRGEAAPRGGPLMSWLYLPLLPTDATPPPLIVVPYPGLARSAPATLGDYGNPSLTPSIPILVGAGYAVLEPALPLAAGSEPAAGLAARVLSLVEAAALQHPSTFDPDRLALWGHSFGAYGSVVIISQTDRFRAAVAMAPPTDLASGWGIFQAAQRVDPSEGLGVGGRTGWTEDAQGAMHGPPWRDPARYLRNSPVFQADRIHTPLMMMVGDQDHIPMSQSEEMFSALYRQDRDAVLLTYWGEPHILYSPGNLRDAYRRGLVWLAAYLSPPLRSGVAHAGHPAPASATIAPSTR